jgi:hypothetical protein
MLFFSSASDLSLEGKSSTELQKEKILLFVDAVN